MTVFCTLDGDQRACRRGRVFARAARDEAAGRADARERFGARLCAGGGGKPAARGNRPPGARTVQPFAARVCGRAQAGAVDGLRRSQRGGHGRGQPVPGTGPRQGLALSGNADCEPGTRSRAAWPLMRAFALYGVPLSFSDSRSASQHPLGRALTGTLRLFAGRYRAGGRDRPGAHGLYEHSGGGG